MVVVGGKSSTSSSSGGGSLSEGLGAIKIHNFDTDIHIVLYAMYTKAEEDIEGWGGAEYKNENIWVTPTFDHTMHDSYDMCY